MKLSVQRDQVAKKGMLGGHRGVEFSLRFRLLLTPEEQGLVQHYKFGDHWLLSRRLEGLEVPLVTVSEAVSGKTMQMSTVTELISREEEIKESCRNIKTLFEIAQTFGGEEVFEISGRFDPEDQSAPALGGASQ